MPDPNRKVLPGFGLSLGVTVLYLSILVVIPLAAGFAKAFSLTFDEFWAAAWTDRAVAAYTLTLGTALAAAVINVPLGVLVAWVLVRYDFPLRRLVDSVIDLPFALPTAVAGLAYSTLYAENGWLGQYLFPLGIELTNTRGAIVLVLVFVSFPFVVRSVQPVLQDMEKEIEEAAASLGANRFQTFRRVILPALFPAITSGFTLAFARAVGEYGSVVFVSGNMPYQTEIAPYLVYMRLEEFAYAEAIAIGVTLLTMSFAMLLVINLVDRWSKKGHA